MLDIIHLDATAQKQLIEQKEISAYELTEHYIKRIEKFNPKLNAVVHTMFDQALEQAKQYKPDATLFGGVPFLIKDLNNIKGLPTTSGSKLMDGFTAMEDDIFVKRYREAGLIFLGKTNTPEFGFLPTTEPDHLGPTKNPWALDRSSGGSSGGAAAAVASGMAPFAHGSDGGGSIRIPASACGLFGYKPSRGQVPFGLYMNNFGVNHALTKSVRDSAGLLDIIKGAGPGESYPSFAENTPLLSNIDKDPGRLKIAVDPDWRGRVSISEESRNAVNHAVRLLESLGHEVKYQPLPFEFEAFANHFITSWIAGGSLLIKHMAKWNETKPSKDKLEPISYHVFNLGSHLSASEYEEARVMLMRESQKIHTFHDQYDVLLTPVLNGLPSLLDSFSNGEDATKDMMYNFTDICSFTPIANVTGQPSMSVPLYWTAHGLPVGVQFTGRLGKDDLMFRLAAQLERAQSWASYY
ncbi:amidase [Thalassobacillus cyri]|uniref:Amidase n=1 Tax=Thalassobacillus cyri TaxID=571932 RepID=A0A1H3Y4Y2_9BACI|nr:amidase [Thalassobacillus cyri]SEA05898.1 amidase [Thalassobacillus cyri]